MRVRARAVGAMVRQAGARMPTSCATPSLAARRAAPNVSVTGLSGAAHISAERAERVTLLADELRGQSVVHAPRAAIKVELSPPLCTSLWAGTTASVSAPPPLAVVGRQLMQLPAGDQAGVISGGAAVDSPFVQAAQQLRSDAAAGSVVSASVQGALVASADLPSPAAGRGSGKISRVAGVGAYDSKTSFFHRRASDQGVAPTAVVAPPQQLAFEEVGSVGQGTPSPEASAPDSALALLGASVEVEVLGWAQATMRRLRAKHSVRDRSAAVEEVGRETRARTAAETGSRQ